MSACSERIEFAIRLAHETGAPAHQLMPILRRLHRLATTHQRRCEIACNGCRTCRGHGFVRGFSDNLFGCEEFEPSTNRKRGARPCPTCSTKTVEDAIRKTCGELDRLRAESTLLASRARIAIYNTRASEGWHSRFDGCASGDGSEWVGPTLHYCENALPPIGGEFAPIFQRDPRGATVRIRVPSGASNMSDGDGLYVPTSGGR